MPCGKKRKRQKIKTHKRKKLRRRLRHLKKRAWGGKG
jgi:hypothetical protein